MGLLATFPHHYCHDHKHSRPCPHCGFGGARAGAGRPATMEDPVRVLVTLEREELEKAQATFPGSKSQALRRAVVRGLEGE